MFIASVIPVTVLWPACMHQLEYTKEDSPMERRLVRMVYRDSKYIRARCEFKQALRTFRIDRVNTLINLGTGEVLIGSLFGEYNGQY